MKALGMSGGGAAACVKDRLKLPLCGASGQRAGVTGVVPGNGFQVFWVLLAALKD